MMRNRVRALPYIVLLLVAHPFAQVRHLPLEGAANFRDIGGYPTADGHHVKWGLVYRSNHLVDLTAADYEYLNTLGIKLVCDLRTDGERRKSPTVWQGGKAPRDHDGVHPERDRRRAHTGAAEGAGVAEGRGRVERDLRPHGRPNPRTIRARAAAPRARRSCRRLRTAPPARIGPAYSARSC